MEFHCDKFSIQCTWLSIIKCLWQVENILKYLTLFKVILICVMTNNQFSSVTQSWLFVTPWTVACQTSLSITNSWNLLKLMSIESVMPSNHLTTLLLLPSVLPASGSFPVSNFFASGGWSTGASVSASVIPVNIQDWFSLGLTSLILLAVQGTLKSFFQHHSSKTSIFQCSVFFIVQFSHPYMTTGNSSSESKRGFYSPGISRLQVCFASQIQSP